VDVRELGSAPILPDRPVGNDPSYEPEFEALQTEIDKLSKVSADGQGVDWPKVVSLGQEILARKGKHLLAGAYWSAGLAEASGVAGLALGAHVLRDMVESSWDGLFPPLKRMRGRLAAISWWKDRTKAFLEALADPAPLEPALVEEFAGDVKGLDEFLAGKTDEAPVLRDLVDAIRRLPVLEPAPEPEPAAQAAAPAAASPAGQGAPPAGGLAQAMARSAAASPSPARPAPGADPESLLSAAFEYLGQAAGLLLASDLKDPLPYRLSRLAAWTTITGLPMAEKGVSLLPPPEDSAREALTRLAAARQPEDLVREAESRVGQYLFWLDPSRHAAQALDALGAREAAEAVARCTAAFVQRLPGIEGLSFSDGTPFANSQTRGWLRGLSVAPADGPGQPQSGDRPASREALDKSRELAGERKFVEAVTLLQEALRAAGSGRERFTLLVALTRLLGESGRPDLARPNVDELLRLIDEYRLEKWDPDTALQGFLAAFESLRDETDEEAKAQARLALMRMARINPAAAMRLDG
jgi:type VI secretion system protein VasJ